MRRQRRFDRHSRWIFIISRRVSLTITLKLGLLTSLCITVTLSQRLEQTVWHTVRILISLLQIKEFG